MKNRNTLDMTEGPIVKKLLLFAVPINSKKKYPPLAEAI